MKFARLTLVAAVLLPTFLCFGCGDDKSSNGTDPIPTELVDTWWFESGSIDGDPVLSYSEFASDASATSASLTFTSDGEWFTVEYNDSAEPVFTQFGTFEVNDNTLAFRTTEREGVPLDPVYEFEMTFAVATEELVLIGISGGTEYIGILIINYTKGE